MIRLTKTISESGRRLDNVREHLKKHNAAFKKMTKAQQRVRIAKDVIDQLAIKKLIAKSTYFCPVVEGRFNPSLEKDQYGYDTGPCQLDELDVSEVTSQIKCQVCGIGSMFVTAVERADKLKVGGTQSGYLGDREDMVTYLGTWFSRSMLDQVEHYFEYRTDLETMGNPIVDEPNKDKRLRMIMENIISNDGAFKPTKGKHGGKVVR